jgi:hypothetical protein
MHGLVALFLGVIALGIILLLVGLVALCVLVVALSMIMASVISRLAINTIDVDGSLIHGYMQQEDEPFSFPLAAFCPWQSS